MLLQMMTPDLQHVTCRVIARLRLDRLGLNARRLPRPTAVRRSMQESGRVTPLIPHVLRQKVAGNEDCAVLPDLNSVTTPLDFSISLLDEDQVRISEIRESIEHARKRSQEKLTDNEQAEFDRCRRVWQQIVWSLMTSAEVRFNH